MTIDRELKRGSAEMMILSLVEEQARHGYEILKLLEERSEGVIELHIGSVYPILYRLERRGWIRGARAEGARRRRSYGITAEGRRVLEQQRHTWREVAAAIARVARVRHA
jgi:DNA-binding PadR family transcriptional regulator